MSSRRARLFGRRSRAAVVFAATLLAPAAGAVGCSALISLDGTTGGSDEAGLTTLRPDTGTNVVSPGDTGTPGTGAHDGGPVDAASDARSSRGDDAGDAGKAGTGFCATEAGGASFCDDFDEETSFSRWTEVDLYIADIGDLSATAFLSPPQSFEVNMPAYTSPTYFKEALLETIAAPAVSSGVSFSFDFLPAMTPDGGADDDTYVASIAQGQKQAPRSAISVRVGADGVVLQEQYTTLATGDMFNDAQPPAPWNPDPTAWVHFEITIAYSPTPTATVVQDGATVLTLNLVGADWSATAAADFWLGSWFETSTPGYHVFYDNAVIRRF